MLLILQYFFFGKFLCINCLVHFVYSCDLKNVFKYKNIYWYILWIKTCEFIDNNFDFWFNFVRIINSISIDFHFLFFNSYILWDDKNTKCKYIYCMCIIPNDTTISFGLFAVLVDAFRLKSLISLELIPPSISC